MKHLGSLIRIVLLTLTASSQLAYAETGGSGFADTLSGQTIIGGSGGGSGGNGQYQVDVSNMKVNDTSGKGREYKASEAANLANQGKAAATAAGVSHMSAAIPKLASPIAAIRAEGAALMAKAMTEFAQAAADAGVASKNQAQKNRLTASDNQNGTQSKAGRGEPSPSKDIDAFQALSANKEVTDFLTNRGINSENFLQQATSGQLSAADALKMIGEESVAGSPEPLGHPDTTRISMDESRGVNPEAARAAAEGLAAAAQAGTNPGAGSAASSGATVSTAEARALAAALGQAEGGPGAGASPGSAVTAANGLAAEGNGTPKEKANNGQGVELSPELLALIYPGVAGGALARLTPAELAQRGIVRLHPQLKIFDLARSNYRSFNQWRTRKTKVARREPGRPVDPSREPLRRAKLLVHAEPTR